MLSSFPSPSSDMIPGIGVKYYGVMIALGVLAAVSVARRRWRAAGHDPDEVADIAVWAVPFGLVGARLYHVITDWEIYRDRPFPRVLEIWNGGLGIPGGIFLGVVGGVLAARYYKIGVPGLADAMAPAIPLAQAIGRLGNYFNQELFGKPSTLPWAVRIDLEHRPSANGLPLDQGGIPKYPGATSFQPTFLYEALWNLGAFGLLVWIDSKKLLRQGKMLPAYVVAYFSGRLWVEALRDDFANKILGLRVNTWVSLVMIAVGLVWLFWGGLLRPVEERGVHPTPWTPENDALDGNGSVDGASADAAPIDESESVPAGSAAAVLGEDGVAEGGPELDGPVAEGGIAEGDDGEATDGVDPDERA